MINQKKRNKNLSSNCHFRSGLTHEVSTKITHDSFELTEIYPVMQRSMSYTFNKNFRSQCHSFGEIYSLGYISSNIPLETLLAS